MARALQTRKGSGKAYRLESRGQPLRVHAVVVCVDCDREYAMVHTQEKLNPHLVYQRFARIGWEMNQTTARCPECAQKHRRRKAAFARMGEMQSTNISLVKPQAQTQAAAPASRVADRVAERATLTYLVVVDGATGVPSIRSLEGAQEMLFGSVEYLCIPKEAD